MNYYDDENNILERFTYVNADETILMPNDADTEHIFELLHDSNNIKKWIDSSGKNDLPPDFYLPSEKLMMDIMRIDDRGRIINGKVINYDNAIESKRYKELLSIFGEELINKEVFINAPSDLPSKQHHNYNFYINNFNRVLLKHNSKIENYKINHIGYKTIFFVFDEATQYLLAKDYSDAQKEYKKGVIRQCYLYCNFLDNRFISIINKLNCDYLVWYCPFHYVNMDYKGKFPKAIIYNLNGNIITNGKNYDENLIISSEE